MRKVLGFLRFFLLSVLALVGLAAALLGWFVYSPSPAIPQLSGSLSHSSIKVGGLERTYLTYVPRGLAKGAPLVIVMHGSGENGRQIRSETGYEFDRLADEHGFAVVYPNAYEGEWDDCAVVGDDSAHKLDIDDVRFLTATVDKLAGEIGVDTSRVFATGVSAGGFMSIRLALEAPSRFRAVAAVSANVATLENFKCKPVGQGTSVMIVNGTKDPLVPFDGGEVNLLGFFYKCGNVRSSRESAQYFADLEGIVGKPATKQTPAADGVAVEQVLWRNGSRSEVELVAIHGGGHGLPQAYWRRPRLLGPSPMEPDGPAMIWDFFARQKR